MKPPNPTPNNNNSNKTYSSIHAFQIVNPTKATKSMIQTLNSIRDGLLCPLCNKVMIDPATLLQCSHTFCKDCIEDYTCNSWICPFPTCGLPVSNRGKSKSYISINPQISGVISSLDNIITCLNSTSSEWWKNNHCSSGGSSNSSSNSSCGGIRKRVSLLRNYTTTQEFEEEEEEEENNDDEEEKGNSNKDNHEESASKYEDDKQQKMKNQRNENDNETTPSKRRKIEFNEEIIDDNENIVIHNSEYDQSNDINSGDNNNDFDDEDDYDEQTQQYSMINENDVYGDEEEDEEDARDNKQINNSNNNKNNNKDTIINETGNDNHGLIEVIHSQPFSQSSQHNIVGVINTPTAPPFNQSCAIPTSLSPKLSPIAMAHSPMVDSTEVQYHRKSSSGGDGVTKSEKLMKTTFEELLQSLLKRIDDTTASSSSETIQLSCNNGLFDDYCLYFPSEFDKGLKQLVVIENANSKSMKKNNQGFDYDTMTKGRICFLLNMCGAEMKDIQSYVDGERRLLSERKHSLVLLPTDDLSVASRKDIQLLCDKMKMEDNGSDLAIVQLQWVFDSILGFGVRDFKDYTVERRATS